MGCHFYDITWQLPGDRIPVGGVVLRAHSASCTMGIGSFQVVKWLGRADDFPPLSSAEAAKGFKLYLPLRCVPLHEYYNMWALFVVRSTLMKGRDRFLSECEYQS